MYGFESYISIPIKLANGCIFGTLFAIDPRPAKLDTPETIGMFQLFAELIGFQLEAVERVAVSEASLLDERQSSEQREQFIAVLGHDLRDPLTSIDVGADMLLEGPLDDRSRNIVGLIKTSAARMSGMIEDVLDLARGRLGGGLPLERNADAPLRPVLDQVVAEQQSRWPDRAIAAQFMITRPISCDRQRIARLFSNLLGNALTHGAADQPIRVSAMTTGGDRSAVSSVHARRRPAQSRGTGSRSLYRFGNCRRPWRRIVGRIFAAGNPLHVHHAAQGWAARGRAAR
jgi:signal transduction histidine kinase